MWAGPTQKGLENMLVVQKLRIKKYACSLKSWAKKKPAATLVATGS
tara:strand:- start:215 stop:352 length:138 start_codon:yes stop_codon:yes gene_type:complete